MKTESGKLERREMKGKKVGSWEKEPQTFCYSNKNKGAIARERASAITLLSALSHPSSISDPAIPTFFRVRHFWKIGVDDLVARYPFEPWKLKPAKDSIRFTK